MEREFASVANSHFGKEYMKLARDLMSTEIFSVDENKEFNHVEVVAELRGIRHVPIVNQNRELVGIVSLRDLLAHLSNAAASHFVPIKEIMHRSVISVQIDTPLIEVARVMTEKQIGCVPVVEGKILVGLISERDFLKLASKGESL